MSYECVFFPPHANHGTIRSEKNLLAQEYVKEYKYPWTRPTPGCLEWEHRKSLIIDKLLDAGRKADIVCLQEAQVDLFGELLSGLSPVYDGVIQNVTGGHNVGRSFVKIRNGSSRCQQYLRFYCSSKFTRRRGTLSFLDLMLCDVAS